MLFLSHLVKHAVHFCFQCRCSTTMRPRTNLRKQQVHWKMKEFNRKRKQPLTRLVDSIRLKARKSAEQLNRDLEAVNLVELSLPSHTGLLLCKQDQLHSIYRPTQRAWLMSPIIGPALHLSHSIQVDALTYCPNRVCNFFAAVVSGCYLVSLVLSGRRFRAIL